MKDNFEKEFNDIMNEKKEIPVKVRQSLDQSYEMIRSKSKKKKANFIWKRIAAAACALIVIGVVLANEQVMASIHEFFNFRDKGIEQAVNNGFTQENNSTVTDQNIKITLDKHFSDANKIGMSFQIEFEDPSLLNNAKEISMDYRLKNGDGEYIEEFIPDTKPLKGDNKYSGGVEDQNPILDVKMGRVQYDVILTSNEGVFPDLKDAVVEIESINIFSDSRESNKIERKLKEIIDGKWHLSLVNKNEKNADSSVEFVMNDKTSIIQVSKATANPTSLSITFSVDGTNENENRFANRMKIIDENGNEYNSGSGFSMDIINDETIISTNFQITSYNNSKKLKLIVEGIGEVELLRK